MSPAAEPSELPAGVECFARGFASTRALTYPCEATHFSGAWCVRDGPRRNAKNYRVEEWISAALPPRELLVLAQQQARGLFKLCHLVTTADEESAMRAAYRTLSCRLMTTEPMFVHDLRRMPLAHSPSGYTVERITTEDQMHLLWKANRNRKLILPEHLRPDSPVRCHMVLGPGGVPVGSVRSIGVGDRAWVAGLHVDALHRRKGLGSALMAAMLRDDRSRGIRQSVLLASHTGALLYPKLGYRRIALLLLYVPPRIRGRSSLRPAGT
jgi:GNAT superfamily N-acetyltransferase